MSDIDYECDYTTSGGVRCVLADALVTVERERDSLRAQLTASQAETLELRRENTALRAYAQKAGCPYGHSPGGKCERIETGVVLWRDRGGDVWDVEPTDEDFVFGPFTRGRFVADEVPNA